MGRSQRRELRSRIRVVLMHLLKLQFSPSPSESSLRSWGATLDTQRIELADLLDENPSLAAKVGPVIEEVYSNAVRLAVKETGLAAEIFPARVPYDQNQVKDPNFLPTR
jgi:hypothetical protein